jgi:hypothetical protein
MTQKLTDVKEIHKTRNKEPMTKKLPGSQPYNPHNDPNHPIPENAACTHPTTNRDF